MSVNKKNIEKLILDNMGLVHYVVNELCNVPRHLREDAVAEGYLALCRAAKKYKKSVGVNFSTYACVVISRQIFCFVKKNVLQEKKEEEYSKRLSEELKHKMFVSHKNIDEIVDIKLQKEVNCLLSRIIAEKEKGKTIREISQETGVEQDKIIRMLSKWRKSYARACDI